MLQKTYVYDRIEEQLEKKKLKLIEGNCTSKKVGYTYFDYNFHAWK